MKYFNLEEIAEQQSVRVLVHIHIYNEIPETMNVFREKRLFSFIVSEVPIHDQLALCLCTCG